MQHSFHEAVETIIEKNGVSLSPYQIEPSFQTSLVMVLGLNCHAREPETELGP
jgi:hypothetical protein